MWDKCVRLFREAGLWVILCLAATAVVITGVAMFIAMLAVSLVLAPVAIPSGLFLLHVCDKESSRLQPLRSSRRPLPSPSPD